MAGVDVVTGTEVDASFIADQKPDAAIIAVGGVRDTLELSETTGTKVIPLPDFLTAEIGSEVTIVGSNAQAVDAALYLMAQGKHVTMVTPDSMDQFDKGQSNWVKTFVKPMLLARGMRIWPHAEIVSVGRRRGDDRRRNGRGNHPFLRCRHRGDGHASQPVAWRGNVRHRGACRRAMRPNLGTLPKP